MKLEADSGGHLGYSGSNVELLDPVAVGRELIALAHRLDEIKHSYREAEEGIVTARRLLRLQYAQALEDAYEKHPPTLAKALAESECRAQLAATEMEKARRDSFKEEGRQTETQISAYQSALSLWKSLNGAEWRSL